MHRGISRHQPGFRQSLAHRSIPQTQTGSPTPTVYPPQIISHEQNVPSAPPGRIHHATPHPRRSTARQHTWSNPLHYFHSRSARSRTKANRNVCWRHSNPGISNLQTHLHRLEHCLQQWRICANECKSTQISFTLRRDDCPPVYLNGRPIPQNNAVKYLSLHLDRRLTWRTHILAKRKQLDLSFKRMYWIIGKIRSCPVHTNQPRRSHKGQRRPQE